MALAFICGVAVLFALVLVCEGQASGEESLRPAGLLRWLMAGNWTAKIGGLLLSIGSGALLRYLMQHVTYPPSVRILSGIAIATLFGAAGAWLATLPQRRAISLALTGASLAVAYLTAYSAYALFHFVADLQALGLLFLVACVATVVAVRRKAVSIAVLAMAGAYIAPAFALHGSDPLPVYGYYVVASLITLAMVWLRGWRPLIHLSFLFTLAGSLFFAWTQSFYTPQYYPQMQPMLLMLVALHLAMPLLERRGTLASGAGVWARAFDQAYFIALPLVATTLTLLLAPRLPHEGAQGLLELAALWLVAAGWQQFFAGTGASRYLAVALVFGLAAALMAATDVPVFLLAALAACAVLAAGESLRLSRAIEILCITAALATSAGFILQSLFAPVSGLALLNLQFGEQLLLGGALLGAAWGLRLRQRELANIFLVYAGAWLLLALARQLVRLNLAHVAQLAYLAVLAAILVLIAVAKLRARAPHRVGVAVCGIALLVAGLAAAEEFSTGVLLPLMLAGQILYSLMAFARDHYDAEDDATGAIARSALPLLALPWAVALSQRWAAPNDDMILTLLVLSALFASLQSQWLIRKPTVWPNWLSPIGFTLFGLILFGKTLAYIERETWAVAFDCLALLYLVETARYLWISRNRDATLYAYVATAACASVSAAMVLRLFGPPGTLSILDLNRMLLPAVVSLLWASAGAVMTWLSTRRHSRILWSLGALLMLTAALKLILFDFGSLGQIANILAMMAAGGVFLLVAWLAPFPPPKAAQPPKREAPHVVHVTSERRGWLTVAVIVLLFLGYYYIKSHPLHERPLVDPMASVARAAPAPETTATSPLPTGSVSPHADPAQSLPTAAATEDSCRRFVQALPARYQVYVSGDVPRPVDEQNNSAVHRPTFMNLRLRNTGQDIVLALGAEGPVVWQLEPDDAAQVVGIILSGLHRNTLIGAPANIPILNASQDDHASCGYFHVADDAPQAADGFVSALLGHAVDSYLPSGNVPRSTAGSSGGRVNLLAVTYSSPRTGQSLNVTDAAKSQCADSISDCAIRCGNQLAGDPDFGQRKVCQVLYTCGTANTRSARIQEGTTLHIRCN